jgi:hypothetical protein
MASIVVAAVLGMLAPAPDARVAGPLTVRATTAKKTVRVEEPFDVRLRVVNASGTAQTFRVMNCSWDEHWKSSNPAVSWEGWACTKNYPVAVTLQPGEAYEKTLSMLLTKGAPGDEVSFKMGFRPIGSKRTYWSQKVTVRVEKGKPGQR